MFSSSIKKKYTRRFYIGRSCNLVNSFTIESSFGLYIDKNMQNVSFEEEKFLKVGEEIGRGLD